MKTSIKRMLVCPLPCAKVTLGILGVCLIKCASPKIFLSSKFLLVYNHKFPLLPKKYQNLLKIQLSTLYKSFISANFILKTSFSKILYLVFKVQTSCQNKGQKLYLMNLNGNITKQFFVNSE